MFLSSAKIFVSKLSLNRQITDVRSMHHRSAGPAGRMQASPQNTQLIAIIVDHLAKSRVKTLISDFYGKPQKC